MSEFSAEELALDGSEARRKLDNALVCLWDIDGRKLTHRERQRLSTINSKIEELAEIIEEREIGELES
jgi:hypothetical protein